MHGDYQEIFAKHLIFAEYTIFKCEFRVSLNSAKNKIPQTSRVNKIMRIITEQQFSRIPQKFAKNKYIRKLNYTKVFLAYFPSKYSGIF